MDDLVKSVKSQSKELKTMLSAGKVLVWPKQLHVSMDPFFMEADNEMTVEAAEEGFVGGQVEYVDMSQHRLTYQSNLRYTIANAIWENHVGHRNILFCHPALRQGTRVTAAIIEIVEKPWERMYIDGQSHEHGFKLGSEKHTTEVTVKKSGALLVTSGIEGLAVLKTTKSGFEGFVRDKYTILLETRERMLATEVITSWRYSFDSLSSIPAKPLYFNERYLNVKKVLVDTFFGPPKEGVYSSSVQSTLYQMAEAVLARSLSLSQNDNMARCFKDDVYLPTDEPHGSIEASLSCILSKM
ncbi:hypothetical protein HYC85_014050 [Camellia sinensis]|uniref:Uricase n=1 Tax=Camellia sinensis TaxID=4442 RepID=A0A7J7H553_CAMSI|nr:hypothetical protein HYC85_014050 [Camellia sinensis]